MLTLAEEKGNGKEFLSLAPGYWPDVSPELWMGIQADYDLEVARLASQKRIEKSVQPLRALQAIAA